MTTKFAKYAGIVAQGAVLGISLYFAILMLWVQSGEGRIFQYQGF